MFVRILLLNFFKSINLITETAMTMTDIEVEKKVEFKVDKKTEAERDMEDAADKVRAGAKAVGNKIHEPDKDLDTEYAVEKIKKKLD